MNSKRTGDILLLLNGLVILVLLNVLGSMFFFRWDLTEEKRYSIKDQTKQVLNNLDDRVYVEVYLEGDLNAGFRRFRKAIAETLEEFRIYSNNKVQYTFIDPAAAMGSKARKEFMSDLASKGIQPKNVIDNQNGKRVEKLIFPGAVVSYGQAEEGVMLLKGNSEREINPSIEGIEYQLVNAIHKLTNIERKQIGIITGHGELEGPGAAGYLSALSEVYDLRRINLANASKVLQVDALIIAKPLTRFSDSDKFKIDQYVMNGGNVVFLVDRLEVSMDSVSRADYFAFPYDLQLDDLLFRYGVRVNPDLVKDQNAGLYPVVTNTQGSRPEVQLMPWPYFPLINRYADHPMSRNMDAVVTRFVSTIDTVKAEGIRKTPLLFTSQYSRRMTAPVRVSLDELRADADPGQFNNSFLPVGYLLEGTFSSLFKNRFAPAGVDTAGVRYSGQPAKIIVISDGDILRNEVNPRNGKPQALGFDPFTNYTFANQELLMNMMAYMTDAQGLITTRNKEIKIRPLDKQRIADERIKWQMINIALPLVLLIVFGILKSYWRKKQFTRA